MRNGELIARNFQLSLFSDEVYKMSDDESYDRPMNHYEDLIERPKQTVIHQPSADLKKPKVEFVEPKSYAVFQSQDQEFEYRRCWPCICFAVLVSSILIGAAVACVLYFVVLPTNLPRQQEDHSSKFTFEPISRSKSSKLLFRS